MIPFCVPQDHVVINLAAIVRIVEHPALASAGEINGTRGKWIEVHMSDGQRLEFDGNHAEIVLSQVMTAFQVFQGHLTAAAQQMQSANSGIVIPSMKPPPAH